MYRVVFTKQAVKDAEKLKMAGLSDKGKSLVEILKEDPFRNPPPYERLVGNLDGFYSRRINIKHRLVYMVFDGKTEGYDGIVKIIRMWTHYDEV